MRRSTLTVAVTGLVLAAAAVVTLAVGVAGRHGPAAGKTSIATTSRSKQGTNLTLGHGAVSPGIGLRAGAASPNADGLAYATSVVGKLTPLQLAGQRTIYSYRGLTPPWQLLSLIRHGEVAGVIFFAGNVGTPAHLASVVRELQQAAASSLDPVRLPLLLMTDQEGGAVRRLPGQPYLSARQIGLSARPGTAATNAGSGAGANLRGIGLNVNLAPVLDVYRQAGNFIDEFGRSFSASPAVVSRLGTLFATAEQHRGVAATCKHFPGLGAATRTQNTDLRPVTLRLSLGQIRSVDELPYKAAIAAKAKLVMVSWALYPALDARRPAGLSAKIVKGELRGRLGFAGVTITDALEAGALSPFGSVGNRARLAATAGMDLLLSSDGDYREGLGVTNSLTALYKSDSASAKDSFKAAVERVLALRASLSHV